MSEEKKPGLLKRIFSFGFGRKKQEDPDSGQVEEKPALVDEAQAEADAKAAAAEREAEAAAVREAEAAKRRAEAEAARKALAEAEAALKKTEEEAAARKAAEAEEARKAREAEKARKQQEAAAKKAEQAAAKKAAREAAAKQKAAEQAAAEQEKAEKKAAEELEKAEKKAAAEREKAEKKVAAEREKAEKKAAEEREKAEKEAAEEAARLEAERLVAEKAAQEAAAAAKAAEEAAAAQQAAEEKAAEEKAAAERAAAEKAASERAARDEAAPDAEEEEDTERKLGWFKRLRKGLSRSSSNLSERITSVFTKKKLDEDTLQDLEDILIQADLGVETAMNVTDALSAQRYGKDVTDEEVRQIMADEITKVLEPVAMPLELDLSYQPHVILVVGVNGSGKTTTIGKLSQKLHDSGYDTMLVAGDTFRAAAIEQLHIWGDRTQATVMSREHGADAAGLAFDAWAQAKAEGKDVMMMDTAGRLQNRKELMDELEKIIRVLKKQDPAAPHTVLLTLDATTGQNALNQVEIFKDVAGVNGLVMTKLDGTARGGILVSIASKHKLPVYFVGVGEQVEDLEPFEADVFARAIAGLDELYDE